MKQKAFPKKAFLVIPVKGFFREKGTFLILEKAQLNLFLTKGHFSEKKGTFRRKRAKSTKQKALKKDIFSPP